MSKSAIKRIAGNRAGTPGTAWRAGSGKTAGSGALLTGWGGFALPAYMGAVKSGRNGLNACFGLARSLFGCCLGYSCLVPDALAAFLPVFRLVNVLVFAGGKVVFFGIKLHVRKAWGRFDDSCFVLSGIGKEGLVGQGGFAGIRRRKGRVSRGWPRKKGFLADCRG